VISRLQHKNPAAIVTARLEEKSRLDELSEALGGCRLKMQRRVFPIFPRAAAAIGGTVKLDFPVAVLAQVDVVAREEMLAAAAPSQFTQGPPILTGVALLEEHELAARRLREGHAQDHGRKFRRRKERRANSCATERAVGGAVMMMSAAATSVGSDPKPHRPAFVKQSD
jgi:hypothetical protein